MRNLFSLAILLCALAASAVELTVDRFGPEHGLSGHPLTVIARDRDDRIWVGSFGGGAFRFDGTSWRQFTSRDGLLSDRVVGLIPGSQGEMWVSTAPDQVGRGGLSVVHQDGVLPSVSGEQWEASIGIEIGNGDVWFGFRAGGVGRFRTGTLSPIDGLEGVRVRRIVESHDGTLWFAGHLHGRARTAHGVLARWDGKSFQRFGAGDGLPGTPFFDLLERRDQTLWVATGTGPLWRVGARFDVPLTRGVSLERSVVALSEDADSRLWLATSSAVLAIDGHESVEYRLPLELGPVDVLEIAGSPQGGVFVRTPGHLLRLEGRAVEVLELEDRRAMLPPGPPEEMLRFEADLDDVLESSRLLLIDREGSAWAIGARNVYRYSGDEARRFDRDEGLASTEVNAIAADDRGRVYVGTSRGLVRFDPEVGFFQGVVGSQESIVSLAIDRGGAVYAGLSRGVLRATDLDIAPWPPGDDLEEVRAFAFEGDGTLVLGHKHGIARSTIAGLARRGSRDGLAASSVLSLRATAQHLYVGQATGLFRSEGERFVVVPGFEGIRIDQLLPLPEGVAGEVLAVTPVGLFAAPGARFVPPGSSGSRIYAAHLTRSGDLWVGVDIGLLKSRDGVESLLSGGQFPIDPILAIAEDSRGAIWMGTGRGLFRHRPRATTGDLTIRPFGRENGAEVELSQECPDLWVRFSAMSYLGPRKSSDLRIESRLLPVEPEFSAPLRIREREFTGLGPGTYTLEARAVTRELRRSTTASLTIVVAGGVSSTDSVPVTPAVPEPEVGSPSPLPSPTPVRKLVLPPIARP